MNIADVNIERASELAVIVKDTLAGEKPHDVIAALAVVVANIGVDIGVTFDDMISDMDTVRQMLFEKEVY